MSWTPEKIDNKESMVTLAAVQMEPHLGEKEANVAKSVKMINEAADKGEAFAEEAEAAQKAFDMAVAEFTPAADLHIGSAVIFALIGFVLVSGIEIAGKIAGSKQK